jgi:hypothetical protein
LARIILSHALLESIRFVMSRKECRDIYGLINSVTIHVGTFPPISPMLREPGARPDRLRGPNSSTQSKASAWTIQ